MKLMKDSIFKFLKKNKELLDRPDPLLDELYRNNKTDLIKLLGDSKFLGIEEEKIEKLIYMAGSVEELAKDEIPYAEYNVSCDPEAAEVIFDSGLKIEIVPMEMGHTAYLDWEEVFRTKNENFVGSVLEIIYRSYKDRHVKNGIATHDGCAIAYLTNPEIFKVKPVFAYVKYFDEISTGVLMMNFKRKPNATTCVSMDIKKFKKLYFNSLKKCK